MSQEPPTLSMWTIYRGASDVDAPYCVREWCVFADGVVEAGLPVPAQSLAEAQEAVPRGLYRLPRAADDDPVIVESWV